MRRAHFQHLLGERREHRNHTERAAGSTGDFHRQGDHVESPMWKIAEIAQILEHRHVLGKKSDMRLECAGLPKIDRGGIDPNGFDLPFA